MKKKLTVLSLVAVALMGAGGALIPLHYSAVSPDGSVTLNEASANSKRLSAREQRVFRKRINERLQRLERMTWTRTSSTSSSTRQNNNNSNSDNSSNGNNSNNNGSGN